MPLSINVRSYNYFGCNTHAVVYNGTFGAHHFCVEYLCAFVFVDIGYESLRWKIPSSINTLHGIGCTTILFASKVP